ncbi:unnamed protein product [Arctia plantaginis]|uniref:Uncharacterized protein n=1 Tax=Arctia plantaginis TaxID=874455 RepID=A0A8S1BQX3_ARCPL|nr:unnamed protein product [Arctia plantaginis]
MLKVLPLTSLNGDTDYISSKSSDMSSLYYLMLSPCRSSMGARVSDRIKPDLLLDESGCEADMLEGAEVGRHSPPRPQQEPINLKNEALYKKTGRSTYSPDNMDYSDSRIANGKSRKNIGGEKK